VPPISKPSVADRWPGRAGPGRSSIAVLEIREQAPCIHGRLVIDSWNASVLLRRVREGLDSTRLLDVDSFVFDCIHGRARARASRPFIAIAIAIAIAAIADAVVAIAIPAAITTATATATAALSHRDDIF